MGILSKVFNKSDSNDRYILKKVKVSSMPSELKDLPDMYALVAKEDIICPTDGIAGFPKGRLVAKKGDIVAYVDKKSYEASNHFNDSTFFGKGWHTPSLSIIINSEISNSIIVQSENISNSTISDSIIDVKIVSDSKVHKSKLSASDSRISPNRSGVINCEVKESTIYWGTGTRPFINSSIIESDLCDAYLNYESPVQRDNIRFNIYKSDITSVDLYKLASRVYKAVSGSELDLNENMVIDIKNKEINHFEEEYKDWKTVIAEGGVTIQRVIHCGKRKQIALEEDAKMFEAYDNKKKPQKVSHVKIEDQDIDNDQSLEEDGLAKALFVD